MTEQESSPITPGRPSRTLRLVPPPLPAPGPPGRERVLVLAEDFRLTSEWLEAGDRAWRLEDLRGFRTRHQAPGVRLPLLVGMGAALVVPSLMLQPGSARVTAALVVATVLVFASIVRLVMAQDTYWLTVRTVEGERLVLRCQDHQLFARVVEALGELLERPEPRPVVAVRRLALVR